MLLGKKSKPERQLDWAVILDRAADDFAKKRVSQKLAQVFHLSLQEAGDLTENTPLILFDQLSEDVASKIKSYFSQSRINCFLTSDTFTKRKCFRAVWPEGPNLAPFLAKTNGFGSTGFGSGDGTELQDSEKPGSVGGSFSNLSAEQQPNTSLAGTAQTQRLPSSRDNTLETQAAELMREVENVRAEKAGLLEQLARAEGENARLNQLKTKWEQQSYERKEHFEDNTLQETRAKMEEMKSQLEQFRSEHVRLQHLLRKAGEDTQRTQDECREIQESLHSAQIEARQYQSEWSKTQKELSEARLECEELKRMLSQTETNSVQLKEDLEQVRAELTGRFESQMSELEEWKRKAADWSSNYSKVIQENEFLRAQQSEELDSLRVRNRELANQLEQAQKQIRGFSSQVEQQELIQKRMKVAGELTEHEAKLKTLVQNQRALEKELSRTEEELKNALAEQDIIEREVVKAKQVQKYLMEQSKLRTKSRFGRSGTEEPLSSSFDEPGTDFSTSGS